MEGINQFIIYTYTWKCHNETPCLGILNKNVLFQKNGGQKGKTSPVWRLVPVAEGRT
jgi:hypothetical protein